MPRVLRPIEILGVGIIKCVICNHRFALVPRLHLQDLILRQTCFMQHAHRIGVRSHHAQQAIDGFAITLQQ
jgi:hypothetical protein